VLEWAEEALEFLGRRVLGEYEVDEFGHDPDLVEHVLAPLLRPLYRHWWRVETRGLEHVPDSGPALVVGNHAGTLPFDALMVALALLDEHPAHRSLRMLAADLAFNLPVVAPLARKSGNTLACAEDATRLLEAGELVGVWPEGYKGLGKPYRERYRLQRFGRGGFVEIALRTGAPIVPVAVVGSEEIYPMVANLRRLARLLGFPYFPVTPTFPLLGPLGAIPLPSKWVIEFCPPIETADLGPEAMLDPMVLFDLTDQVRDTIQQTVLRNLLGRRGVFGFTYRAYRGTTVWRPAAEASGRPAHAPDLETPHGPAPGRRPARPGPEPGGRSLPRQGAGRQGRQAWAAAPGHRPPRRQRLPARAHPRLLPAGDRDGCRLHRARPGLDQGPRPGDQARERHRRHHRRRRPPRVRLPPDHQDD
jgi:1-acyl-sn-glycerol-3-phosphate acyltransferase